MNIPSFDNSSTRTYKRPELIEYGTLREVTLSVGSTPTANSDGGGPTNANKTR